MSPTFLLFTTRTQLLAEGYAWRDGTQSKKGLLHTAYGIPSRIKLGALYFDRNVVVGEGAQGKISIIEAVADGSFFYDKCLAKAHPNSEFDRWGDIFQEVEHLQEQGICKYFTQIIQPDLDNFLNYEVESHIVMENLGTDLKEQFQTRTELAQDIPDAVRFRIAIEVSFELAKLHGGLLSVKPKMHRDLKPGNVVLGPNGIRFIDFGMTEDDPDKMLYPDRGTPGYIENPAKDQSKKFYYQLERMFTLSIYEAVCDEFEQEEVPNIWCANKRSGRFFDLDALRRLLYTPLREHPHRVAPTQDSVLTEQLVQNYSLGGALERAYSTQDFQYQAEDALKIRDAMTFTAVLIAREVKLSDGQVDCIIADEHLAHAVVGSYFSEKDDWLLHGQAILAQLLTLAPQERWSAVSTWFVLD